MITWSIASFSFDRPITKILDSYSLIVDLSRFFIDKIENKIHWVQIWFIEYIDLLSLILWVNKKYNTCAIIICSVLKKAPYLSSKSIYWLYPSESWETHNYCGSLSNLMLMRPSENMSVIVNVVIRTRNRLW